MPTMPTDDKITRATHGIARDPQPETTNPSDILGPSLARRRRSGVERVVVRQKRRFPLVDESLLTNILDVPAQLEAHPSPPSRLRSDPIPPPPLRLRDIPDNYEYKDYPVTALLAEMEARIGASSGTDRSLTIDIPDIPTSGLTRTRRLNINVDKPLPPTPGSPTPSSASTGSVYSDYVEDEDDGVSPVSGPESTDVDLSEYVVVDLVSAETYDIHTRAGSFNAQKRKLKKFKDLINDRVDARLRAALVPKDRSDGEVKDRPRVAQYIGRVGAILNAPLS